MMFTAQMTQLFAVVLGKDKDRVTEALLREGVMQFIHTSEYETTQSSDLNALEPRNSKGEVTDLRKRVEGFLHTIGIVPTTPQETDLSQRKAVDLKKEGQQLDIIDGERDSIRERQRILQQEILRLEDIQRQVKLYGIGLDNVNMPNKDSVLSIQTGKLQAAQAEQLKGGRWIDQAAGVATIPIEDAMERVAAETSQRRELGQDSGSQTSSSR